MRKYVAMLIGAAVIAGYAASNHAKRVAAETPHSSAQFTADGKTMIYLEQSGSRPNELFRVSSNGGTPVALTPTEWGILGTLATVPGRVYSRFELINKVRGYEFEGYERTVDSHVKNLRRKIEEDPANPRIILTVLGGGYRLGLTRDG